jgi:hypothetical protein
MSRRSYSICLLLLAAGAIAVIVAYGLPWGTVTQSLLGDASAATRTVEVTGRDHAPGAAACGWVALAGLAGIVATRGWLRRVVAVIVAIAGVVAGIAPIVFAVDPGPGTETTLWWLVAVVGGVAIWIAGIWTVVRGNDWPSMGSGYERTPQKDRMSAWQAQDAGRDPTDDLVE